MAKKRPTADEMADLLNQPHFAPPAASSPILAGSDPIMPTPMVLDVDQVKTYDHNPRRVPNSEYQAIYESVEANGLDQALTITRRPGDSHYMVFAGGNTRLEIVQRLWRETANAKYQKANFLFRPWSSDLETLLAHLRENDQRGDLTFIDRAYALVELRQMLEQELGFAEGNGAETAENPPENYMQEVCHGGVCTLHTQVGTEPAKSALLSNQRFAAILRERGYTVRRESLHLYWYAVEELADWIPGILKLGAGHDPIREIYRIDRAFMGTWRFLSLGPDEEARQIFQTLLQRMDDDGELSTDQLWTLLTKELSVSSDDYSLDTCGMLMQEISENGSSGLDWFWELDAKEKERARQGKPVQLPEEPGEQELSDTDTEFELQPWTSSAALANQPGEHEQLPRQRESLPEQSDSSLDARSRNLDWLTPPQSQKQLAEHARQQVGVEDADLDLDDGDTAPLPVPTLPLPGNQDRQGNTQYSYSLAEKLGLPLPAMPDSLQALRQQMTNLARELFRRARLDDQLIHAIPSGVGFIVLPITKAAAEPYDGLTDDWWLHACQVWQEMTEFSQQFMFGSLAHQFIPAVYRETFPAYTAAMEQAEWDTTLFQGYQTADWEAWGQEMPKLSGMHGREARTFQIFIHPAFGDTSLACYMQLVETYRALHRATLGFGRIWEDAQ